MQESVGSHLPPRLSTVQKPPLSSFVFTHSHGPIFHLFSAAGERDHVPALPKGLVILQDKDPWLPCSLMGSKKVTTL